MIHEKILGDLRAYLGGTLRELKSPSLAIGAVDDHIHILYRQSKNLTLAKIVQEIKVSSSGWIKTQGPDLAEFQWQNGYGAFSVSASRLEAVKTYILNQEEHHKTVSFQEEFRLFLKKAGLEFDERYVWD